MLRRVIRGAIILLLAPQNSLILQGQEMSLGGVQAVIERGYVDFLVGLVPPAVHHFADELLELLPLLGVVDLGDGRNRELVHVVDVLGLGLLLLLLLMDTWWLQTKACLLSRSDSLLEHALLHRCMSAPARLPAKVLMYRAPKALAHRAYALIRALS